MSESVYLVEIFYKTRELITELRFYMDEYSFHITQAYVRIMEFWEISSLDRFVNEFWIVSDLNSQIAQPFIRATNTELKLMWLNYIKSMHSLKAETMRRYGLLLDKDKINNNSVYNELSTTGTTFDRSLSEGIQTIENLSIRMLCPEYKSIEKRLACRTYTTETNLRVNPVEFAEKRHQDKCQHFENYNDDCKIQLQFYIDGETNDPLDVSRGKIFVGFVLLILIPVDMYHPELYNKQTRKKYFKVFELMGTDCDRSKIPKFEGPTYELTYIFVKKEYRNKGIGSKMIKRTAKYYTFTSISDSNMIDRTFVKAECASYGTLKNSSARVFRSTKDYEAKCKCGCAVAKNICGISR